MGRKEQRQVSKNKKTIKNKKTKQISIFTVFFILAIVAVCVGIYFGVRYLVINLKYKEYTDKMVSYGFSELYDNKKATSTQKATNAEMLKIILGTVTNSKDITKLYYLTDNKLTETENWYNYASHIGLNDIIARNELNSTANRIDAVILMVRSIESILGITIDQTTLDMKETVLAKFTEDEKILIAKAVTLGIIGNKTASVSDSELLKGELNKLAIEIAEKYATIYYGSSKTDANGATQRQNVSIVTNKKEKPSNYEDYPYIVDNIAKEVYEQEYNVITERTFKTPKEVYKTMGYLYEQTDDLLTRYFNNILNIDYETITTEKFLNSIKNEVVYAIDEEDVKTYVDYLKEHKIKLEGKATPLLPIMYNNGEVYAIRTKITFKVLSSDTEYNLLFGDENNTVKYNSKEITMYVDVQAGMTLNSNSLLVQITCLGKNLSQANTSVVVER